MATGGFQYFTNSPTQASDPYYYNAPNNTVNLSGKIGSNDVLGSGGPASASTGASSAAAVVGAVSSAVESGYQQARNVVFGNAAGGSGPYADSSFSLFSLSYQQVMNFTICMAVGTFFMFLAFLFLPMVVFAPQKFTLLFTLGCISWICGLAMLQGTKNLLEAMITKQRLPFSIGYGGSLIGTLYATLVAHSYILTLLCAICQIISLVAFIISYFPGGIRMLSIIKDVLLRRTKELLGLSGSGSVLPI